MRTSTNVGMGITTMTLIWAFDFVLGCRIYTRACPFNRQRIFGYYGCLRLTLWPRLYCICTVLERRVVLVAKYKTVVS
ncbi:hypothetical protein BDZ89DRAFT_750641 [Hymenopellis radicata]|nr:hypothetical protein BDZ89DRAFT_750641 [Hymenopellis radicata]